MVAVLFCLEIAIRAYATKDFLRSHLNKLDTFLLVLVVVTLVLYQVSNAELANAVVVLFRCFLQLFRVSIALYHWSRRRQNLLSTRVDFGDLMGSDSYIPPEYGSHEEEDV